VSATSLPYRLALLDPSSSGKVCTSSGTSRGRASRFRRASLTDTRIGCPRSQRSWCANTSTSSWLRRHPRSGPLLEATKAIPIVMITGDDPVRSGFVASLARPGGNITGVTFLHVDLFAKNMELLKQLVPSLRRVAFLWDPSMPTTSEDLSKVEAAARALDLQLQVVAARGPASRTPAAPPKPRARRRSRA